MRKAALGTMFTYPTERGPEIEALPGGGICAYD